MFICRNAEELHDYLLKY